MSRAEVENGLKRYSDLYDFAPVGYVTLSAEGVISELKLRHGLARARCRGTPLFHVQLLLGCAAINLKRLAMHAPQAASGVAGVTTNQQTVSRAAASAPQPGPPTGSAARPSAQALWTTGLCLN